MAKKQPYYKIVTVDAEGGTHLDGVRGQAAAEAKLAELEKGTVFFQGREIPLVPGKGSVSLWVR